jgi:hypothetical protein
MIVIPLVAAAILSVLSVAWYLISRPNKNSPLSLTIGLIDWRRTAASAVVTGLLYTIFYTLVIEVLARDREVVLPLPDGTLVFLMFLTAIVAGTGHGMHCASKNVSYHLNRIKQHDAYVANRVFHIPFSHHLLYSSATAFAFLVMSLEVNHPDRSVGGAEAFALILLGMMLGAAFGMAVKTGFVIPKVSARHVAYQAIGQGVVILVFGLFFVGRQIDLSRRPVTICLFTAACVAFSVAAFHAARLSRANERRSPANETMSSRKDG